jgi:hypothetical protein
MKQFKFRAVLTLEPAARDHQSKRYPSGTHSLLVRCGRPGLSKYFPANLYPAGGRPLESGDSHVVVTLEVSGDDACAFLWPGQRITLWNGRDVGHGVISRRAFFTGVS